MLDSKTLFPSTVHAIRLENCFSSEEHPDRARHRIRYFMVPLPHSFMLKAEVISIVETTAPDSPHALPVYAQRFIVF